MVELAAVESSCCWSSNMLQWKAAVTEQLQMTFVCPDQFQLHPRLFQTMIFITVVCCVVLNLGLPHRFIVLILWLLYVTVAVAVENLHDYWIVSITSSNFNLDREKGLDLIHLVNPCGGAYSIEWFGFKGRKLPLTIACKTTHRCWNDLLLHVDERHSQVPGFEVVGVQILTIQ